MAQSKAESAKDIAADEAAAAEVALNDANNEANAAVAALNNLERDIASTTAKRNEKQVALADATAQLEVASKNAEAAKTEADAAKNVTSDLKRQRQQLIDKLPGLQLAERNASEGALNTEAKEERARADQSPEAGPLCTPISILTTRDRFSSDRRCNE